MTDDLFEAALDALRLGNRGGALGALLQAWKLERSPHLAELVGELGKEAARGLPAITGSTPSRFDDHWRNVAHSRRPVDVPRLLDGLKHRPWSSFRVRLKHLLDFPDDPRIAAFLAQFVEELPVTVAIGNAGWREVLRFIERLADARCRGPLERRLAQPGGSRLELETIHPGIAKILEQLVVRPEPPMRLLAEIATAIRALEMGAPATPNKLDGFVAPHPREAGLLAAVYSAPHEDGPRLVYADWLLERGDPRAAFIGMQFTRATKQVTKAHLKREATVLTQHLRDWLGPLDPVVHHSTLKFEKGFLASASSTFQTRRQFDELGDHPSWSTVTTLTGDGQHRLLSSCALIGLRTLEQWVGPLLLAQMATRGRPYPRLEGVRLRRGENPDPGLFTQIAHGTSVPRVESLEVTFAASDRLEWLIGTPLGDRLRTLSVHGSELARDHWLRIGEALPHLSRLVIGGTPRCELERLASGWALTIDLNDHWVGIIEELKEVRRVVLVTRKPDPQVEQRIRERFPGREFEVRVITQ